MERWPVLPVGASDRHRAAARNPPQRPHPPPISRLQTHASPTAQNHADMERRSPTGIARERETRTNDPTPRQSHACKPNPQPRRITPTWSAGLRPASRGSAEPHLLRRLRRRGLPNPHQQRWPRQSHGGAPVSDRHRAGARNLHRRPAPANLTAHANPTAWSAGLRPASRGSAKPAPTTLATPISRRSAGLRPASRGSAKPAPTTLRPANLTAERRSPTGIARERETRTDDAGPANLTAWSAGLRPASRGSAKPAPTTLATPIPRLGAPVSDRHRAGARNPHRRRCATPISRLGAPVSDRHRCAKRSENRLNPNPRTARNRSAGIPPDRHRSPQAAKLPSPIPPWRSSAPD